MVKENTLCNFSALNVLRFVWWYRIWLILVHIPGHLKRMGILLVLGGKFQTCWSAPVGRCCWVQACDQLLLVGAAEFLCILAGFCLVALPTVEGWVLKCPSVLVGFSSSPFSSGFVSSHILKLCCLAHPRWGCHVSLGNWLSIPFTLW